MIPDPDLIRYACIAHHHSSKSTILAEFNAADSTLKELAHQCLQFVPPYHSIFSHSYRNQTYTFLIDDPFVFFGIFDPNILKSDQILFLGRLKETLDHLIKDKSNHKFTPFCLQGDLHPIFLKLTSKSFDIGAHNSVPNGVHNTSNNPPLGSNKGRKIVSVSLLSSSKIAKGLKKKRISEENRTDSKEALVGGKLDVLNDDDDDYHDVAEVKSREIMHQNGNCLMDGGGVVRQKAKKIWRRHVWIVLVLDLAVCLILFGIWLFVCSGFQCTEG